MSEPIRNAALDLIDHQEDMTHKAKDGFQPGIAARLAFKDFVVVHAVPANASARANARPRANRNRLGGARTVCRATRCPAESRLSLCASCPG